MKYITSKETDIRGTWLKHWPKSNKSAVKSRIEKQYAINTLVRNNEKYILKVNHE